MPWGNSLLLLQVVVSLQKWIVSIELINVLQELNFHYQFYFQAECSLTSSEQEKRLQEIAIQLQNCQEQVKNG